jgi:hypothetical protein
MLNRLKDVFASCERHDVRYVIIGGIAASLTNPADILANEITVFRDKVRIDVQTSTPGLEFTPAWNRREGMIDDGQRFFVACKADLIASKKASGRAVDREDVRLLELPDAPAD